MQFNAATSQAASYFWIMFHGLQPSRSSFILLCNSKASISAIRYIFLANGLTNTPKPVLFHLPNQLLLGFSGLNDIASRPLRILNSQHFIYFRRYFTEHESKLSYFKVTFRYLLLLYMLLVICIVIESVFTREYSTLNIEYPKYHREPPILSLRSTLQGPPLYLEPFHSHLA